MKTIPEIYADLVADGAIHSDPQQLSVLPELERLRVEVLELAAKPRGLKSIFARRIETPRGLYLWGGVAAVNRC